jgi:beta-glucuronidase
MKHKTMAVLLFITCITALVNALQAQSAMNNIYGRKIISLNGEWKCIPDPAGAGEWRQLWLEKKPQKKTDFVEFSFDEGPSLKVPGDFNTQMPELTYFEGTVWYKKIFEYKQIQNSRIFLHFGAVNYTANIYLNGKLLGSHEGGFTPFMFEITNEVINGSNTIIVKANSERRKDGLPGIGYDWFNYGGITRDVHLIQTGANFIEDYFIHLKKNSLKEISGWVNLNRSESAADIRIEIPGLKINYITKTNSNGYAVISIPARPELWSPENPVLYEIVITSDTDTVREMIGFRTIEAQGTRLLLNGKPVFLKGVNIHEERPFSPARACSEADALVLLTWAKELGCNLVRLAHYPHNEYIVRMAEKMGLMVWDELPVYQHVQFSAPGFTEKMDLMMREMMRRDRNRCGVIIWSLSNETYTDTPDRTKVLVEMTKRCRSIDSTRLITSVLSNQHYENNTFHVWDTLCKHLDIVSINEYLGWYVPWQGDPSAVKWKMVVDKPLIISEFGGEAKFNSNFGPKDEANSWSEEYQEQIYINQVKMFRITPALVGVCPWIMVDYRSPVRMHPVYQGGFNRKGLISEYGEKKKSWQIIKDYYNAF